MEKGMIKLCAINFSKLMRHPIEYPIEYILPTRYFLYLKSKLQETIFNLIIYMNLLR